MFPGTHGTFQSLYYPVYFFPASFFPGFLVYLPWAPSVTSCTRRLYLVHLRLNAFDKCCQRCCSISKTIPEWMKQRQGPLANPSGNLQTCQITQPQFPEINIRITLPGDQQATPGTWAAIPTDATNLESWRWQVGKLKYHNTLLPKFSSFFTNHFLDGYKLFHWFPECCKIDSDSFCQITCWFSEGT